MRAYLIAVALALLLFPGAALAVDPGQPARSVPPARPAPDYVIIVHTDNPTSRVDRRFVANAFLKKITRWPSGAKIRPVDLGPAADARRRFSARVLERPVAAVKSYWQRIIFTGRGVPPPELESDEAVIRYVRKHPGAVGYVSGECELAGVKVLELR